MPALIDQVLIQQLQNLAKCWSWSKTCFSGISCQHSKQFQWLQVFHFQSSPFTYRLLLPLSLSHPFSPLPHCVSPELFFSQLISFPLRSLPLFFLLLIAFFFHAFFHPVSHNFFSVFRSFTVIKHLVLHQGSFSDASEPDSTDEQPPPIPEKQAYADYSNMNPSDPPPVPRRTSTVSTHRQKVGIFSKLFNL